MAEKLINTDVAVVGCGIAGLSAAVAAAEAGANVIVLERATQGERGGNSRWTEAYMRMKSIDEVSEDFELSLIENGSFHADPSVVDWFTRPSQEWPGQVRAQSGLDPEIVDTFARSAAPSLRWLQRLGVRFDDLPIYHLTISSPRIAVVGGGAALVEALASRAEQLGVRFFYETTATALVQNPSGTVRGVLAKSATSGVRFESSATVLASGGFEGNCEMLTRYLGSRAKHLRVVAPGGYFNRGEGIQMALQAGVAPAGEYSLFHAEPVDPRSKQPEAVVFVYSHGILVNRDGQRFTDEAPGFPDQHYETICHKLSDQPDGHGFVIYDSQIEDVPNWRKSIRSEIPPIQADSIHELAGQLKIDSEALEHTIAVFNRACRPNGFSPLKLDGASTRGLHPRKSNWARPLLRPPYFGYPVISAINFTFGGLKTDPSGRAVDNDGNIVAGLFAAGETMGIYHRNYTGATSVLRAIVFGKAAGEAAAALRSQ